MIRYQSGVHSYHPDCECVSCQNHWLLQKILNILEADIEIKVEKPKPSILFEVDNND